MSAVAFINGTFVKAIEHYGYAGIILFDSQKQTVKGSGCSPELIKMWSIGAILKAAEETIKKAHQLGIKNLTLVSNLNAIQTITMGVTKPQQKGTRNYMNFIASIKSEILLSVRRPLDDEKDILKEARDLAREALNI